jgi:hypothetical protein
MTGVEKSYSPKSEAQLSLQSLTIKVNNLPLLLLLRQIQCTCCDFGCAIHRTEITFFCFFCCRPFEMIAYLSLCLLLAASPPQFQAKSISNHGNHLNLRLSPGWPDNIGGPGDKWDTSSAVEVLCRPI